MVDSRPSAAVRPSRGPSRLALVALLTLSLAHAALAATVSAPLRLLYQNELQSLTTPTPGPSFLLVRANVTAARATAACSAYAETIANVALTSGKAPASLQRQLDYLLYSGEIKAGQTLRTQAGLLRVVAAGSVTQASTAASTVAPFALCTNSAPRGSSASPDLSAKWSVTTPAQAGVTFTGYRDALSFRFISLPYANPTPRFEYSSVYAAASGANVNGVGTGRSKQCPQTASTEASWSEDCLVLNVFTPLVPAATSTTTTATTGGQLKPVMFWVHGGGFTSGSGMDPTFDGGELVSRGDVVVVTPNYRLGSLGFLPLDDAHKGNYAIGDLITALQWIRKYGPAFGADPNRVTVFGQSAGAQLVSALLASPAASGLFQSVIIQSGRPYDAANSLQSYQAARNGTAVQGVLANLGCANQTTTAATLSCLRALPTSRFLASGASMFSKPVVDNRLVTVPRVDVRSGNVANKVPVLVGFMRDELAALGRVPPAGQTLEQALTTAGISAGNRSVVLNNTALFPLGPDGTRRVAVDVQTDITSINRCGQLASVYAAAQSGAFPALYAYTQTQRSYALPNYDPNGVCADGLAWLCHSSDLIPVFNTLRYTFNRGARDATDLDYFAVMMDQWTSFARHRNPTPSGAYLKARGYTNSLALVTGGARAWTPTTASDARVLQLGPRQSMVPLTSVRQAQCDKFGRGQDYILKGAAP